MHPKVLNHAVWDESEIPFRPSLLSHCCFLRARAESLFCSSQVLTKQIHLGLHCIQGFGRQERQENKITLPTLLCLDPKPVTLIVTYPLVFIKVVFLAR